MWRIRDCDEADFEPVLALLKQLWPSKELDRTAVHAVYRRAMQSDSQYYVCAVEGEKVIGFCSLTLKNNLWQAGYLAHIDELVVDEQHRGKGIGASLLSNMIERAAKNGCSRVELDSAFHRTEAHAFYEARGFENRGYLFSKVL